MTKSSCSWIGTGGLAAWVLAWVVSLVLSSAAGAQAQDAPAAQPRAMVGADVEGFVAMPVDSGNSDLFGAGGGGAVGFEFNLHPLVGVHVAAAAMFLSASGSSQSSRWLGGRAGLRFHWAEAAGLGASDGWLDAHFSLGDSGGITRPGFDVGVGYAFSVAQGVRLGPFVRVQYSDDPRNEEAVLMQAGLTIGLLGDPRHEVAPVAGAPEGPRDTDADGLLDAEDVCPTVPAGAQPDPRRAGCPAVDADSDGVLDADDACPVDPAGARPDPDRPGCPERDTDADGVSDAQDHCPAVPAGARPDPDRPGCPSGDRDGDGVLDPEDRCPDERAGPHPDPARAGCPLPDGDGDSVPDADDACPEEAGAPSRDPARNGCPGLVRIRAGQIQILRPVFFDVDSARIQERSNEVLEAVVEAMQAGGIQRIRVEGHTDASGRERYNLELSRRRAVSVVQFLAEQGIDGSRLEAVGYGEERPVESNSTEEGRAHNRRVEFHILDAAFAAQPGG